MKYTPNYNLKKPEYTDQTDIPGHFNSNMDTIDGELKNNADAAATAETNANNFASGLIGNLSSLLTTVKTNIVAAINNLKTEVDAHKADYTKHISNIQKIGGCYLANNNQSIASNTAYKQVIFNGTLKVQDYFERQPNGTIKILKAGLYTIQTAVYMANNTNGERQLVVYAGDSPITNMVYAASAWGNGRCLLYHIGQTNLSINDIITVYATQTSGSALDILKDETTIKITRLGD